MGKRMANILCSLALAAGLSACTAMTGESAGRNVDDAAITTSVKTHLAADSARTLTSVDVDTVRGTVYLSGTVPDAESRHRAARIAGEVSGVERVVNNLQTRAGDNPRGNDY